MLETALSLVLGAGLLALTLAWLYLRKWSGYLEGLGIPVVPPVFLFGNPLLKNHQASVHEEDAENLRKFGARATWGQYIGSQPHVVTVDPEFLRAVLVKEFDAFRDRDAFPSPDHVNTLDTSRGATWKNLRKFLGPVFTSGKLKKMLEPMEGYTSRVLEHLGARAGQVVEVQSFFRACALDVIGMCAFGVDFGCLGPDGRVNQDKEVFRSAKDFVNTFRLTTRLDSATFQMYYMFPFVNGIFPEYGIPAFAAIANMIRSIMRERDQRNAAPDSGDFVDTLRRGILGVKGGRQVEAKAREEYLQHLSEDIIMAQGPVFLAAGYETTSNTMTTLSYWLARYPEVQRACYEEVAGVLASHDRIDQTTISDLKYLEACIKEALRLHPPVPRNTRICGRDVEVSGLKIKKGVSILIPIYALQRHRDLVGPDPDDFRPDRFLRGEVHDMAFHAFGAGPRVCIGQRFAMNEIKLLMSQILSKFELQFEPGVTDLQTMKGSPFLLMYPDVLIRIMPRSD